MKSYDNNNTILGGDFNTCLNPNLDKSGGKKENPSQFAVQLNDYMSEIDFIDIWRIRNPDTLRYTRRQNTRGGLIHSRLDFFLLPISLEYEITDAEIKPSIYSDHSIVQISIKKREDSVRGKGFWKFNTSLLTDVEYVSKVKTCINETVVTNKNIEDKTLLWDLLKCNIRGMTISHSSFKTKERNRLENELKFKLEKIEKKLHEDNELDLEYETTKREYEQILNHKTQGLMIRSKAKYIEHGEKNSKYFLNLENHNQNVKNITCLMREDGSTITDSNDILNEEVFFL